MRVGTGGASNMVKVQQWTSSITTKHRNDDKESGLPWNLGKQRYINIVFKKDTIVEIEDDGDSEGRMTRPEINNNESQLLTRYASAKCSIPGYTLTVPVIPRGWLLFPFTRCGNYSSER